MSLSNLRSLSPVLADTFDPMSQTTAYCLEGDIPEELLSENGRVQLCEAIIQLLGLHEAVKSNYGVTFDVEQIQIFHDVFLWIQSQVDPDAEMIQHMIDLESLVKKSLGQPSLTLDCMLVQVIKTIVWRVGPYVQLDLGIVILSSSWFDGYISRHRVAEARCWDDSVATFYNLIRNKLASLPKLVAGAPFSGREISFLKRLHQDVRTKDKVSSDVAQIIKALPDNPPGKLSTISAKDIHTLEELVKVRKSTTIYFTPRDTLSAEETKAYDFFQALLVVGERYHKEYMAAWAMKAIDDVHGVLDGLKPDMHDRTYLIPYQVVIAQKMMASSPLLDKDSMNFMSAKLGVKKGSKKCERCVHMAAGVHSAYDEILEALPGDKSTLASKCNNAKHDFVLKSIQSIQREKVDALKKRDDALKKQDEAGRKNDTLNKKIVQKDRALLERDSIHIAAQRNSDKLVQELQDEARALALKLDSKDDTIRKAQQNTDNVKFDWHKKLQKAFDKNSELRKQLQNEKSVHEVTKLDLGAAQADLDKARATNDRYKATWKENSTRFKEMKAQNDDLRAQVLALRSNDLAEKDRTDAAVRAAVQTVEEAKDKEIAQLRKMYQDTTREFAELKASREKELASSVAERQNELLIQLGIQRSIEEKLKQEREKRAALEEEVAVLVTQKAAAEDYVA